MPITFAHPAAVLPLFRGPFVPAALVAGAVSPDLPYFLRAVGFTVTAQSWYEPYLNATASHSVVGVPTVALPTAFLLYLGMMAAARPAGAVLPDKAGSLRDKPVRTAIAVRIVWALVSLLVGIATHVAWDSLTHGWVAMNVPALQEPLVGSLSAARVLQHSSSVLGLLAVGYFVWRRRERLVPARGTSAHARMYWTLTGATVSGFAGAAVLTALRWEGRMTLEYTLSSAAVGAGLGIAVAAVLVVAAWWLVHWTRITADSARV